MVTHFAEYQIQTTVEVPTPTGQRGLWGRCPGMPAVLGTHIVRGCDELRVILEAQSATIPQLIRTWTLHTGFRILARHQPTGQLMGSAEWIRRPCGVWYPCDDEPFTACAWGVHMPAGVTPEDAVRLAA
ncbi:hypothetical protein [Streptomyces huiliensis]|uniref:hypothetical protein n=1 Tax=Streptomyces huiliensis TaxID=2876027 RepID=UPI001CC11DBE|nr:hypothetical protein [Streptomyces huiliensis]MBZ4319554.1 hypothetical protein [Streptomyces huiliensis]